MHDPDDPNDPIRAGRAMPEIRPLPDGAMPNPPADDAEARHAIEMARMAERQRLIEVRSAANFAMERSPYPNNRQGRRRWARELAKLATTAR